MASILVYAVLVVICALVTMAGCLCCCCCHTRIHYQRYIQDFVPEEAAYDWGPTPSLFDVYLNPLNEKSEMTWRNIVPISVAQGDLDATGASSMAQISVMIRMPSPQPFIAPDPLPDDERYLPFMEIGLSNVDMLLENLTAASKKDR
ncbi:hypothetical protein FB451DRAFT_1269262, partial [Mycena latifolia]